MAAVTPLADQAAIMLENLSLDSQKKSMEIADPAMKPPVVSGDVTNGQIPAYDRLLTPSLSDFMDPTMCYMPYYYRGYDGTGNEWDYSRYMNADGAEMPHCVYGDHGSMMYHHGYGYQPYGPYSPAGSPVPTVGQDAQLYGAQHYQYPAPYFQTPTPNSGPLPSSAVPPKGDKSSTRTADHAPLPVEALKENLNSVGNGGVPKGKNGSAPPKTTYQNIYSNGSYGRGALSGGIATTGYQDPRFSYDGLRFPIPWTEGPLYSDGNSRSMTGSSFKSSLSSGNGIPLSRNQSVHPRSKLMGLHNPRPMSGLNSGNGYMNNMYANKLFSQYGNYRSGYYGSNGYDYQTSGRNWSTADGKYWTRGRGNGFLGYGNENKMDGLNELNKGPRANSTKNQKGFAHITLAVKGQNIPSTETEVSDEQLIVNHAKEQYNCADFSENYADARFFIIKSYSEDDVHKSIKYNFWASTQNGNKKLDAAYQEALQKPSSNSPIFLFFSVNASGQFVGLAEMVGPVDFNKSLEYWQQDKWVGCFPVKWHIVKDVPNSILKHITLENNEDKPVTNSRDTQEVNLEKGLQLLKIFKDHVSMQCILDDFEFYEERQKRFQEKKAKQQQFQKQVWEGKPAGEKKEGTSQKLKDNALDLIKGVTPSIQTNGDVKPPENPAVSDIGDGPITIEKKVVPNGVANGC